MLIKTFGFIESVKYLYCNFNWKTSITHFSSWHISLIQIHEIVSVGSPLPNIGYHKTQAVSLSLRSVPSQGWMLTCAMKAGDEYFISDPHNGDIWGSVSGAPSCYSPLLRCVLPVQRELLAARLASHLPPPGSDPSLHLASRKRREGEAAHTDRGATETEKVSSLRGGMNGNVIGLSERRVTSEGLHDSRLSWKVMLVGYFS